MDGISFDQLMVILNVFITVAMTLFGAYYGIAKGKLHALRTVFDHLDEAMADNTITEDEWNVLYADFKALVKSV